MLLKVVVIFVFLGVVTLCYSHKCHPDEQEWLSCDLCDGWYHCKCIGKSLEEAQVDDFLCPSCSYY